MDEAWRNSFREKLEQHYQWPALYTFKFIVPQHKAEEVKKLFPTRTPEEKSSSQGNYISFTFSMMMPSSDAVIEVYQKATAIEGLIAL
jgi:hypothetical protein